jgi:hypothetical protein
MHMFSFFVKMSTSSRVTVIANNRRLSSYNHWDSYLTGLGNSLVKQVLYLKNIQDVMSKWNNVELVNDKTSPTDEQIKRTFGYGVPNSHLYPRRWNFLLEKAQGNIVAMLDTKLVVEDDTEQEYNYTIDFDKRVFSVKHHSNFLSCSFDELHPNMFK